MVSLDNAVVARYESNGMKFELLVDPNLAHEFKEGNEIDFESMLAADSVFKDALKGDKASPDDIKKVFKTNDFKIIAIKIIREGRIQLTTEQKRKMTEAKRKEIIDFISKHAFNPQTGMPHPPQRIELALNEIKFVVDPFKSAGEQSKKLIEAMQKILPISTQSIRIEVEVPVMLVGKAMPVLHSVSIMKQEWQSNGALKAIVELPGASKNDFFAKLNAVAHGAILTKILQ